MESDISSWIIDRLSVSLPTFNNMPACPFAKQALLRNRVKIIQLDNKHDFEAQLDKLTTMWPEDIEVVVLGTAPNNISSEELTELTETANSTFLKQRGYLALEDHPQELEYVEDFCVNEGNWALILLQASSKIAEARAMLSNRGYYKHWDQNYYNEVVLERS